MLGKTTSYKAITILFYVGIISILVKSILIGKITSVYTTYDKPIEFMRDGVMWHSSVRADNVPLGIFLGILSFIIFVVIWKVICELLIIIFRGFEVYIEKNQRITDESNTSD
jgi:Na+/H+-translocating membrane pyrophosphatase